MSTTFQAATDVGRRREHNEDAYLADPGLQLYVVADGMGGHASGEVASGLAAQAFRDFADERRDLVMGFRDGSPEIEPWMVRRLLEDSLHGACREVYRKAQEAPEMRGMGTTLVALLVAGERAFVCHVGDSRAYLVRGGKTVLLTRDHSVLNELVMRGDISEEAAAKDLMGLRHALSRAVGVCEDVEVDTMDFEVLPGDLFLLASDGLTQYLRPDELTPFAEAPLDEIPGALVALANDRGGSDNITAICVRVDVDSLDPAGDVIRSRDFETKISTFQSLPLFQHLQYGELIRVLSATDVATVPAGEVILREGEEGDAMYVVLCGRIVLEKAGEKIAEFGRGAHFGEVSLIDKAPRSATATVTEEARLLRLRREHLYSLVKRDPEIAVKLLWSFAETLGDRLRTTTDAFADLRALMGGGVVEGV